MARLEDKLNSSPGASPDNSISLESSKEIPASRTSKCSRSSTVRSDKKAQTRRYTVDLTPAAANEVGRIQDMFDLSAVDVFRYALILLRIYADATTENRKVQIVDPKEPKTVTVIQLPMFPK